MIFNLVSVVTNSCVTEQKAQLAERKRERDEKAAENAARVAADIKAKEEAARQSKL